MPYIYSLISLPSRFASYLLLVSLLLLTITGKANDRQHMVPITLEERAQKADIVLEGEVISQTSFWDSRHENIYTSNIIRVFKVFKGEVQAQTVELITEGGTVGLKKHVFSTALDLNKGEQGIFFLEKNQPIQNTPGKSSVIARPYASQQGFIDYNLSGSRTIKDVFNEYASVQDVYKKLTTTIGENYRTVAPNERLLYQPETIEQQQQSAPNAPTVSNFTPTVASAGTGIILTINGSGFGNTRGNGKVEFKNSDDGGKTFMQPLANTYISWSDTQIRMFIPSRGADGGTAGTGVIKVTANDGTSVTTSNEIVIEYAYSNVQFEKRNFRPILINSNNLGGYTMQFAPSMQSRSAAQEGFKRAVNSWICKTQVNWEIGLPTTIEKAADDDKNIIRFAPSSDTGQGVLARTISRYEGCATSSDTLFWVSEFDMEINSAINWQYGPGPPIARQFDFETVALHELGHAHQLGHVILPRAVMHYAIEFEVLVRDLSEADIRGGNFVISKSTGSNICRKAPMQPELEGDCNLAPEILTFEGEFRGGKVELKWQTLRELLVDFFVVQRSQDGDKWQDIATVDAKGPSTGNLNYTYSDATPLPDVSFYRLKVVYNSGATRFSPRVRVLDPASLRVLHLFPNPIPADRGTLRLIYLVQANSTLNINLYNTNGKLVREYSVQLSDANTPIDLPLQGLAAGMYILRWQESNRSGEVKIIKL